jgi:hypothetical protein
MMVTILWRRRQRVRALVSDVPSRSLTAGRPDMIGLVRLLTSMPTTLDFVSTATFCRVSDAHHKRRLASVGIVILTGECFWDPDD